MQYLSLPKSPMVAEIDGNIWAVSEQDLVRDDIAKWRGKNLDKKL